MAGGNVRYILNRKGSNSLQDDSGYVYKKTKSVPSTDKTYWQCVWKRKYSCPVTLVTTDSTMKVFKLSGNHNHSNQLLEKSVRDVEEKKIKMAALVPSIAPRTILGEISMNLEESMAGGTAFMRTKQSLTKAVHRKRLSVEGYPPKPQSYDDLESLPVLLTKTTNKQPFLVLNDTIVPGDMTPMAKRLLVFMSKSGRNVLASSMSWYVDGTFKAAANTLFSQVKN
jgi:hypothetical protein